MAAPPEAIRTTRGAWHYPEQPVADQHHDGEAGQGHGVGVPTSPRPTPRSDSKDSMNRLYAWMLPRAPLRSTQPASERVGGRMAGDPTPCVGVGPARYRWQHRRWSPRRVPVPPSGDYPVQLRRCRRCGNAHHRPVGPPAESQPILGLGLSRSTNIKILNVCWLPHFVDQFRTSERNSYSAPVSLSAKSATSPSRLPVMWTNGKVWG